LVLVVGNQVVILLESLFKLVFKISYTAFDTCHYDDSLTRWHLSAVEEETKNLAEQLVYTAEKALKDLPASAEGQAGSPSVPDDIKNAVNEKITALKKEKEGGTIESIKSATEALSTEMQKIGEYLSKNPPTSTSEQTEPGVKDAEIKENPEDESKAK